MEFSERELVLLERMFFVKFMGLSSDFNQRLQDSDFNSASNIQAVFEEYKALSIKFGLWEGALKALEVFEWFTLTK